MTIKTTFQGHEVPVFAWTEDIEYSAIEQLLNLSRLPIMFKHVAAMPDVHMGVGASVGTVIATKGAIIPSAVGVDIGCGMIAAKTNLNASDLPDNLHALRHSIERSIPLGAGGANSKESEDIRKPWMASLDADHEILIALHPELKTKYNPRQQLGTLGSGNHFIEVCLDTNDSVWIMLHSGSRGIGNLIGRAFISKAKKYAEEFEIHLPDRDLAYLNDGTKEFAEYVFALNFAQRFAEINREVMFSRVIKDLTHFMKRPVEILGHTVNCHHNYSTIENHFGEDVWITRKGAVNAAKGTWGIIPGSMGTKSYIVEGKGEENSFCSCSHGAGRRMSRGDAKRKFTLQDLIDQTSGVECRKDANVIDEIPGAYKDIDVVMENQSDLVDVRAVLRQVLCVKG